MATVASNPLIVPVAELVRRPGARRHVAVSVPAADLALVEARVPDGAPVAVDVELESMADGITVRGSVSAPWNAECRRCLGPAAGVLVAAVDELYQQVMTSDDAFEFDGDLLDLAPMVRETVLLELPLAPVCRADCAGLCAQCGADRNTIDCGHRPGPSDPRWGALDELRGALDDET